MAVKHGLGRGLGALIKEVPAAAPAAAPAPPVTADAPAVATPAGSSQVPIDRIRANPFQPRHHFTPEALDELVNSIRSHGVLQPLLLRPAGGQYELVAGERRLRAARQAGLTTVPAIVKSVSDQDALEQTLIENLQREDLNVMEEAEGYQHLAGSFGLTQDVIAEQVGKARATVANVLRLLTLPAEIKQMLTENRLSPGHGKALLAVAIDDEKCFLARRAAAESWSVRVLEKAVARLARAPRKPRASRVDIPAAQLQYLSDQLHKHFGTSVRLIPCRTLANGRKVKGSLEIDFFSSEDLNRILDMLGLTEKE